MFLGGSCREPRGGKAGGRVWRRKAIEPEGAGQDGGDGSKCQRRGRFSQFIFILYIHIQFYITILYSWCSLAGGAAGLPGGARTALAARTRRNAKIQSGSSLPRGHIQHDI